MQYTWLSSGKSRTVALAVDTYTLLVGELI